MKLGYSRLSSEAQTEGLSLEAQKDILERADCDRIYTDVESGWTGKSGKSSDREEFQKMLTDARNLRADNWPVEIIFPEFSRWARNTITSMGLIEELENIGVTLRSMDIGVISVATAGQWLNTMQQSMMAEFYSRNLSDKVRRMYDLKRSTGRPLQHKPPLGWKLSDDRQCLLPNHDFYKDTGYTQWELSRKLVELYLESGSFGVVERWANGIGLSWHASTIRKWMINPINQGHTWWYKQKLRKGQYRNTTNSEREFIYNTHEPLITPGEMERIKQRMIEGGQNRGINIRRGVSSLQGLAYCAACGHTMKRSANPTTKRKDYAYLRCVYPGCEVQHGRSYPYDKAEQALIDAIVDHAEDVARLGIEPEEKVKPAELIKLEADRDEIMQLLKRRESPGLRQALEEVEAQIGKFSEPEDAVIDPGDLQDMVDAISNPKIFDLLSREEKRTIFVALCQKIIVDVSAKRMRDRKILEIVLKF